MRLGRLCCLWLMGLLLLTSLTQCEPDPNPDPDPGPDPGGGLGKKGRGKNKADRRNRNRDRGDRPRKNRNRMKNKTKSTPAPEEVLTTAVPNVPISELPKRVATAEELLLRDVFNHYSSDARAGVDSQETVDVDIQYTLLGIRGLDERTQVLTTTGLVITEWVDDRLQWEPERYNNLTDIVVPPSYVWLPELALMNGAEQMVNDFDRMGVLVSHDGKMHWEPGGIFTTTCDIDITYFPFDLQNCQIIVGAWAYYSQKMKLLNSSSEIKLHDYTENGEWEILDTHVVWNETVLPCCPDIRYTYVSSELYLKRRTSYYFVNIVLPCFMLSVLVLMSFCLPPEAGEKISCGISVMLAFTVFLLMVSESVPRTSLQLPVIAIYLTCTMILGTISTCLSILVLNVFHTHTVGPVPDVIRRIILTKMAHLLCINTNYNTVKLWRRKPAKKRQPREKNQLHNKLYAPKGSSMDSLFEILTTQGLLNSHLSAQRLRQTSSNTTCVDDQPEQHNSPGVTLRDLPGTSVRRKFPGVGFKRRSSGSPRSETSVKSATSDEEQKWQRDWGDVTCVLDRMFFCLVLTAMITSTVFTLGSPFFIRSIR